MVLSIVLGSFHNRFGIQALAVICNQYKESTVTALILNLQEHRRAMALSAPTATVGGAAPAWLWRRNLVILCRLDISSLAMSAKFVRCTARRSRASNV